MHQMVCIFLQRQDQVHRTFAVGSRCTMIFVYEAPHFSQVLLKLHQARKWHLLRFHKYLLCHVLAVFRFDNRKKINLQWPCLSPPDRAYDLAISSAHTTCKTCFTIRMACTCLDAKQEIVLWYPDPRKIHFLFQYYDAQTQMKNEDVPRELWKEEE